MELVSCIMLNGWINEWWIGKDVKKAVVTYCYTVPPLDMHGDKKKNLLGFPVYDLLGMTYPAAYPKMTFISDRIVPQ